nr:FAD-dependent oxidoreductase [Fimbriimonadaceae bacterium]
LSRGDFRTLADVAVVGAGVAGLCSALELIKAGHSVTVFDKQDRNHEGTSWGNAGMIVPSHFVPLASRGMLAVGLKHMARPDSPFGIKWSLDRRLWRWLFKFVRAAMADPASREHQILQLNLKSRARYVELAGDLGVRLNEGGLMMVCRYSKTFEHEKTFAEAATRHGLRVTVLDREALLEREPAYHAVCGAVLFEDDCWISASEFMSALLDRCGELGVRFEYSHPIRRLDELAQFDQVILTTGAAPDLLPSHISVVSGKGLGFTISGDPPIRTCAILVDDRIAISPNLGGLRVTATMVLGDLTTGHSEARLHRVCRGLESYLPSLGRVEPNSVWTGFRPCSADGLPIVQRLDSRTIVATGQGMMGMSLGPQTGFQVAELVG